MYLYIFICSAKYYLLCLIIAWSKMVLHRSFAGWYGDSMPMHISGNIILLNVKKKKLFAIYLLWRHYYPQICENFIHQKLQPMLYSATKKTVGWLDSFVLECKKQNEAANEYQCLNQQNFLYFLTCKGTTRGTIGRLMPRFDNVVSCFVSLLNSFLFHQAIHICKSNRPVEVE